MHRRFPSMSASRRDASMNRKRFSLPQACDCGARGTVTFEEGAVCRPGELHPRVKVVDVEGPFRVDEDGTLVCLACEEMANAR